LEESAQGFSGLLGPGTKSMHVEDDRREHNQSEIHIIFCRHILSARSAGISGLRSLKHEEQHSQCRSAGGLDAFLLSKKSGVRRGARRRGAVDSTWCMKLGQARWIQDMTRGIATTFYAENSILPAEH
jgi:hypothetical protein